MKKQNLTEKLNILRTKQKQVDAAWEKTGNKALIEFFVDIIPKVLDVERCSIFVHDPSEEKVWIQSGTGIGERQIEVPKSSSVVGRVVETGQPVVEYDMLSMVGAHDTEAMRTGFTVKDTLCVPVHGVSVDRITGAIQVLNKKGIDPEYSQEDLKILERLSFHLEMNIENIFLRQELAKISSEMGAKIAELEKRLAKAG